MAEDWDNLIILDACRYDTLTELHSLQGRLRPVVSQGGTSKEFFDRNFTEDAYPNTVYVSGNSHLQRVESRFHDRLRPFKDDRDPLWPDRFDDPPDTVLPETMVEWTLDAHEEYPNKRLIAHFMQPHAPFYGDIGEQIFTRGPNWYEEVEAGNLSPRDARQAYRETLELALPHVETLVEELPGKTVVTADHGELFGENIFGLAGHPGGDIYLSDLVTVPWLEIEGDERKEIVPGTATEGPTEMTDEMRETLRDLGYVV
ncbi:hypothetical protein VB773_08950 [Haloarculaceae archaeon H-GB2-1]|nr:hypothetical protein [Haloarculaceae archaeon H-GB2-1]